MITLTLSADTTPWFLHLAHLGVRWYRSDARCRKNAGDRPPSTAECCDMSAAVMSTPLGKLIVTVAAYRECCSTAATATGDGRRRRTSVAGEYRGNNNRVVGTTSRRGLFEEPDLPSPTRARSSSDPRTPPPTRRKVPPIALRPDPRRVDRARPCRACIQGVAH